MNNGSLDPETIAAFLDGRLKGDERERVTRALLSYPELYELTVEAAAVRAELPESNVIPIPVPWWRRPVPAAAASLAAAAAVAAVLLVPAGGSDALRLVADASWQEPGGSAGLGEDWNRIQWPASRSAAPTSVPANAAFRAGVLLVNIEVAAKLNDSARATSAGGELSEVMSTVEGGSSAAALAASVTTAQGRRNLTRRLEQLFGDSPWYELGMWIGQARLAAIASDPEFFAPDADAAKALNEVRERLGETPGIGSNSNSQAALNQISELLDQINAGRFDSSNVAARESLERILTTGASVR